MIHVTDTHPFLWYLAGDPRLGNTAKAIFDDAEKGATTIVAPTIILAESLRVLEKKRLTLKFRDVLRKLEVGWNYTVMPLDLRVVTRLPSLPRLTELHDRIIVASADLLGAFLITKDSVIKKAGYVRTVW